MSNNTCNTAGGTNYNFGVLAGPIAAGTSANFQVPSGSNRTIYMGGYATDGTTGGCPSLMNMQSIQSHISPPVFLGSVGGVNMNPDSTVNISVPVTATLLTSNQIQNCSGAITGGGNNNGPGNGNTGPGNNGQQTVGGMMYTSGSGADGPLSIAAATTYTTDTLLGGKPFNAMSRIYSINQTSGSQANSATVWSSGGSQWVVGQEVMISLIAAGYNPSDTSNNAFVNSLSLVGPDSICGGGWYRGKYIFTHIQSISGDTLTFSDNITTSDALNTTAINQTYMDGSKSFCDFRVVRVPNLSSVSFASNNSVIQPPASGFDPAASSSWATNVGLFVVFRVSGTLTGVSGGGGHNINADGLGFPNTTANSSGYSINGGNSLSGSSNAAGALAFTSGYGSGGANFGNAGNDYSAADATGSSQGVGSWCSPCSLENRIYAGGAGGGVPSNTGTAGGGIIMVFAHQFSSTGTTWSMSANGTSITSGNGGAGAGGSVLLVANLLNTNSNLQMTAQGGNGASAYHGGAGGGGSAEVVYCLNQNQLPTFIVSGGTACYAGTGSCTPGGAGNPLNVNQNNSACNL
jgi:hypothetical protein